MQPVAQVAQQVEDAQPDRDVEHRDRLVGQQDLGVGRQRAGDRDALALPSGQLVRELVHVPGRGRELHPREQLLERGLELRAAQPALVDPDAARERVAHGVDRVQRPERVLEDHLHAPHVGAERPAAARGGVLAVQQDPAARRGHELREQPGDRRLAGAGLADERDDVPAVQLDGHVVDGVDHGGAAQAADREVLAQVDRLQDGHAVVRVVVGATGRGGMGFTGLT